MENKWRSIRLLPALLAIAAVPLIVAVKSYEIGMNGFNWFGNTDTGMDLFLYWKGQALILLALFMLMLTMISAVTVKKKQPEWKKIQVPEMAWLGIYFILALVSSLCSEYKDFALWGSYEQWEGMNVIFAYCVLLAYMYLMVDSEKTIRLVIYGIIAGSFVLGAIGTGQFLQHDLFRSEFGMKLMNLLAETPMSFSFNFPEGWVYATLYNPNYIGSYSALILPIVVMVSAIKWKEIPRVWSVLAMISTCLNIVTLLGSQSLTGCVGVIASGILLVIYMFPRLYRSLGWKKVLGGAIVGIACIAVICVMYPEQVKMGTDKLFHPKQNVHVTKKLLSTDKGIEITTIHDDVFYLNFTGNGEQPFSMVDAKEQEITLLKDQQKNRYYSEDARLQDFTFYPRTVTVVDKQYEAVRILNPYYYREWTIAKVGEEFKYYNAFQKLDEMKETEAIGFENSQYFGDKRGFIWSRTFPLLTDYIVLGSGANTFTFVYPNDDYVGMNNMNYCGVTMTKPHNMYLQTWVQTGLLSLLAYLLLVAWYIVKSLKLYWKCSLQTIPQKAGVAVMLAVFGYLVTGLANDSCVAVAPIFWGMLGLGMAINRVVAGNK